MDMSFANQALSAEFIAEASRRAGEPRSTWSPAEIDKAIAALKLKAMTHRDRYAETTEQAKYLDSWETE